MLPHMVASTGRWTRCICHPSVDFTAAFCVGACERVLVEQYQQGLHILMTGAVYV